MLTLTRNWFSFRDDNTFTKMFLHIPPNLTGNNGLNTGSIELWGTNKENNTQSTGTNIHGITILVDSARIYMRYGITYPTVPYTDSWPFNVSHQILDQTTAEGGYTSSAPDYYISTYNPNEPNIFTFELTSDLKFNVEKYINTSPNSDGTITGTPISYNDIFNTTNYPSISGQFSTFSKYLFRQYNSGSNSALYTRIKEYNIKIS
jgi:hypothetical protein